MSNAALVSSRMDMLGIRLITDAYCNVERTSKFPVVLASLFSAEDLGWQSDLSSFMSGCVSREKSE